MSWSLLVILTAGGALSALVWCLIYATIAKSRPVEFEIVFRPPRVLIVIAVAIPGGVGVWLLSNAFGDLIQSGPSTKTVSYGISATIAFLLALLAFLDATRTFVAIQNGVVISRSLGKNLSIPMDDVESVLGYVGHLALKLKTGKVVLVSGSMAWSYRLRHYLSLQLGLNRRAGSRQLMKSQMNEGERHSPR